ncbi:hypothetical protein EXIGLDRAFT_768988 [Exidia glandulosa HHB12029]|uniref:BTB domain-containing protein n=1 Tax=Exidia glandulosa HHB12029 TaxID=1314781 RepID=A0A165HTF1_EXIGL|nr:hypothetical protein EXIGLDRAFT_768988 [Exidia glandulosa HHB12029]
MFSLPQPDTGAATDDAVVLHNDAEDFEHFLWFIHADAVDLVQLNTQPVHKQLSRYLGVATIAHMYEAPAITLWAQDRLFSALEHVKFVLPQTIAKLLRFARSMESARNGLPVALKLVDAVHGSLYRLAHLHPTRAEYPADLSDMVQVLENDREMDLLAQVYYYLLVYRDDEWMSDARLRPVDRQRLLCGSHMMRRKRIITCDGSNDREEYRKESTFDGQLVGHLFELWSYFDLAPWRLPSTTSTGVC